MKKKDQEKIKAEVCQVCLTDDPPEKNKGKDKSNSDAALQRKKALELYQCCICKSKVHKYCYDPTLQDSKTFKCDICKNSLKTKKQNKKCFICNNDSLMLKYIEQNKFAHIHCALASELLIVQNFKTLKFKFKSTQQISANKKNSQKRCQICKSGSSDGIFKCFHEGCQKYGHIHCIQQNKIFNIDQSDVLYNLINQTNGSFRIRNADFLKKHYHGVFKGLGLLAKYQKSNIPMITCHQHSLKVIWCGQCFQVGDANSLTECSRCLRWVHSACLKMKNKSQQQYLQCNACMTNQKFMQRALFPELIYGMVMIQTSQKSLETQQQKFLDCFAFKSSTQIQNKLMSTGNYFDFQYYQLYQFLDKVFLQGLFNPNKKQAIATILSTIDSKFLKTINDKRIIQIMYYMRYRQLKKPGQFTANDINSLRDIYPNKKALQKRNSQLVAKQEDKKKIIQKILDVYLKNMKQAQIKDIGIKFIQLTDKIKRQIANTKQQFSIDNKSISREQYFQQLGAVFKRKPMQIALDIRQVLRMLSTYKDKLKGKFDIQPILNAQGQQQRPQCLAKSNKKDKAPNLYNNFLIVLIKCLLSRDQGFQNQFIESSDLEDLLNCFRKIIYINRINAKNLAPKLTLTDQQYHKILNKKYESHKTHLSQQSKIKISKFFKSLLKQSQIKQSFEVKTQLAAKYDQLIAQDRLNYKQIQVMKQNIAQQGLFIDKHSRMINLDKRTMYYKVLKLKYMKIVNSQLSSENINLKGNNGQPKFGYPLIINQKTRKDVLENVKRLLDANNKSILLTDSQKTSLQYFLVKQEVFNNILKQQSGLGTKLDAYNSDVIEQEIKSQQLNEQFKNNQFEQNSQKQANQNEIITQKKVNQRSLSGPLTTFQRIKRIFLYWMHTALPSSYHVLKIIYPIAENNIKFPFQYQTIFNDLIDSLGQRYNLMMGLNDHLTNTGNVHHRINSDQFMKLWKLIQYSELQQSYQKLATLSRQYTEWLYDLEHRFNPIAKALQDSYQNGQLLSTIDKKISDAQRFQIDLKTQVKKLKLVKLWSTLSQKFIKDFQRKPTISAIQQFKGLMIKINYPHNKIYQKVIDLQNYGRHLNERIQKYLRKTKQQDLQLYEQLTILNTKMTLNQAQNLRQQLQNCKLDVSAQLQQLEDQIANFTQIPNKLQSLIKKSSIQQLLKIKTKIIDTPIRYQNLEAYCQLYHRISYLKADALEAQTTLNKKEFFRLLNTADLGAVKLVQKFPALAKSYKELERAEKQIVGIKPKFENMLPIDGKKIRNDLQSDPSTHQYVDRIYRKVDGLREKFRKYKSQKAYLQKYVELENELSHYPVNYKQIQLQIQRMKRDIQNLQQRTQLVKKNYNPSQAISILKMYKVSAVKSKSLDQLKKIHQCYEQCQQLSDNIEDYASFSSKCRQYKELQTFISLNQQRSQLFGQFYAQLIQQKSTNQQNQDKKFYITALNTLIHQGTYLLHYVYGSRGSKKRDQFLQKILKISKKLQQLSSSAGASKQKKSSKMRYSGQQDQFDDDQDDDSDDDSGRNGQGYDEDQQNQDDFQDDYQDDYDDYDDDESIQQPPKKRSQPLVMEISDEDQAPQQPEPRKIVNTGAGPSGQIALQINSQNQQIQIEQSSKQV